MKPPTWKKIGSKIVYENPWIKIHEDAVITPAKQQSIYAYAERIGAGPVIVPLNEKGETYLVSQYRYPIEKTCWQFPNGSGEKGETELKIAQRELLEETGLVAHSWIRIGEFYIDPGGTNQKAGVYLARDLTETKHSHIGSEADMQVRKVPLDKIDGLITNQEIIDAWTLSSLYLFKKYLR